MTDLRNPRPAPLRAAHHARGPALLALLTAALLGLGACGHEGPALEPEAATIQAALATAERQELAQRVELYGVVEAARTVDVSARVLAMITAVHVQTGDTVRAGQALLDIDPQTARGQLSQAQGGLGQAQAALALAERNFERFKALREVDAASELELDTARMQYEQARGAVEQARGAVQSAASVAGDTRVVAPFAGRVVQRLAEVGDLAAPGRPLLRLESSGDRRLVLTVSETLMARAALSVGDHLPARLDARPELGELEVTVAEVAPGADPSSHSFRIKATLPVADLPSGSTGRAWLEGAKRSAVTVPPEALLRHGGMTLVVIRDAEGRAVTRVVTTGETVTATGGERIEILSGLEGGETVALDLPAIPPMGTKIEDRS